MKKESTALIILAFSAIYLVWGTTYLAILFGLKGFPPFTLSALRFGIAGLLLLGWCVLRGEKLPAGRDYKVPCISGVVMLVGGSGLVTWSEQYVTSGQAAIVIATEPFLFLLFDKKRWPLYFSGKRVTGGMVVGFVGIVLFFLLAKTPTGRAVVLWWKMAGYAVLFSSAVLWVGGSLYAKSRIPTYLSNIATTAVQLLAAGLFSGVVGGATGEWNHFSFAAVGVEAWGGLLYLIVFGSLVAYLAFTWLLKIRPPAVVSTHTYVNPVVAVTIGWIVAHEPITAMQIGALALILTGVMLVNAKVDATENDRAGNAAFAAAAQGELV